MIRASGERNAWSSAGSILIPALPASLAAAGGRAFSAAWKADSSNPNSSARGLTQFLKGTWKEQALNTTTYLHEKAIEFKYVEKQITNEVIKKAQKGKPAVIKEKTIYVIKNEQKLLDMRLDPEFAIIESVDYGVQNIKVLSAKFKKIDGLNDSDKAKFFYLTHHLGVKDAERFIKNEISEARAKEILGKQVGNAQAEERSTSEKGGSYLLAHRRWLIKFINVNINPIKFACDKGKVKESQSLFSLLLNIGGVHPNNFMIKAEIEE